MTELKVYSNQKCIARLSHSLAGSPTYYSLQVRLSVGLVWLLFLSFAVKISLDNILTVINTNWTSVKSVVHNLRPFPLHQNWLRVGDIFLSFISTLAIETWRREQLWIEIKLFFPFTDQLNYIYIIPEYATMGTSTMNQSHPCFIVVFGLFLTIELPYVKVLSVANCGCRRPQPVSVGLGNEVKSICRSLSLGSSSRWAVKRLSWELNFNTYRYSIVVSRISFVGSI